MAEDQTDDSQKTEEPTQKRLDDAREKGQIATSREINNWFIILGATLILTMMGPSVATKIAAMLRTFVEQPHELRIDPGSFGHLFADVAVGAGLILLAPLGLMVVLAAASGLVQHGFLLAPEKIKPKFENISVAKGLKRLFSIRSLVEFVKGLLKIAIVGTVATLLVLPEIRDLDLLPTLEITDLLRRLSWLGVRLLGGVLAVVTIIAGLDFLFQKSQHMKQMRMSRQEIKDEFKQMEGDPTIKARLRQIRQERARRRMMAAVPESTVVVTNPTHYAVALKYELETMNAPVLVAKGADLIAQRIREIARENSVPVIENPPLARALFASCDIDQEIPGEHYKAVADIIGYVFRLQGKLRPKRA